MILILIDGEREGGREGGRARTYLGEVLEDSLNVTVLFDLGEGGLGADAADGAGVVAAHQNAEVDELSGGQRRVRGPGIISDSINALFLCNY